MWRDEFLARERIAERERTLRDGIRARALLRGDDVPAAGSGPGGGTARRTVARLLAAGARGALVVAHRLDATIDVNRDHGHRTVHG